jgi:hypothetical protein
MSITPPTGILDITDAIVRVSKLEFRGATGFDTILNNVARNTILLVDQNVEYVADKAWGLKLPNAWISEFEAYWDSGASGNIDFNIYNNTTSGTNGYTISMDDTTITVKYDGGSALKTVSLGSTLRNDTWRKIHILFERDMISLALDGTRVLYFKDTLIRPRVYDEDSGYVVASGLSADRKVKNIRIMNGDKWMTDNSSNIAYVHGNVGIGTTQAAYTLDVKGDIRATGNLLIEGLTTTVDTQNLSIEDAIVEIGRGNDGGTSGKDVGFLFTRNNGTNTTNSNVALVYDESTDRLTFGYSDGSPTDSTLAINTSKSLDVVIPSGNLGIGTANPLSTFQIGTNTGVVYTNNPLDDNTVSIFGKGVAPTLAANSDMNATLFLSTNDDFVENKGSSIALAARHFNFGGGNQHLTCARISGVASGGFSGDFVVETQNNGSLYERMRILPNGNVGIGTTNPGTKLHLHDSSSSTSHQMLSIENPYVFGFNTGQDIGSSIVYRSRWQGDGLSDPVDMCTIEGRKEANANYGDSYIAFKTRYETDRLNGGAGTLSEKMRISGNGNVGIGTTNPGTALEIYGEGKDFTFKYDTGLTRQSAANRDSYYSAKENSIKRVGDRNLLDNSPFTPDTTHEILFGFSDTYTQWQTNDEYYPSYNEMRFKLWTPTNSTTGSLNDIMTLRSNGNVGIGTVTPYAPLHVNGAGGTISSSDRSYFRWSSTGLTKNTNSWTNMSIYANASIACGNFFVSHSGTVGASDTRIKKNIVDADDAECLETLRLLKPKKYQYKDEIERGTERVWGFIAQEVRETLPYATQLRKDVLPNIYELANVSQSNVITFTNFNTSNLESNATTLIRTKGIDGQDHDIHLAEVIDEHTIRVEEDLSAWTGSVDETGNVITEITTTTLTPEEYETLEDKSGYVANITGYQNANVVVSIEEYNALEDTTGYEEIVQDYTKTTTTYPGTQLFVYGQEVDDFLFVKKEAIWTVATSALQEVDRQLQAEKAKVATLETQLASVLARLDALESA